MVATPLVEPYVEAGRELIQDLDRGGVEVAAALWLFRSEANDWRLLIASSLVDTHGPREAYRRIQAFLKPWAPLSLRNVSVVSPRADMIRLLRKAIHTGRGVSDIRFTANTIDGVFIEDALIYRMS